MNLKESKAFPSKSNKILFSHDDPVFHRSFIYEVIQAGSQYIIPLAPAVIIFWVRSNEPSFVQG
jgi:hypothetical protein